MNREQLFLLLQKYIKKCPISMKMTDWHYHIFFIPCIVASKKSNEDLETFSIAYPCLAVCRYDDNG